MKINVNLKVELRNNFSNQFIWFLVLVYKRIRKNFIFGKKILKFLIRQNNYLLKTTFLEILKYKNIFNRDILILSLLKKNPYCLQLWFQLFSDKLLLIEKLNILTSAIFFFPKNKFFSICLTLVFGVEVVSVKKNFFNLKRLFQLIIMISYNNKLLFKNRKIWKILEKNFNFVLLKFLDLKKINKLDFQKKISENHLRETYFLINLNRFLNFNMNNIRMLTLKICPIVLLRPHNLKIFKIKRNSDKNIIFSVLRNFSFLKNKDKDNCFEINDITSSLKLYVLRFSKRQLEFGFKCTLSYPCRYILFEKNSFLKFNKNFQKNKKAPSFNENRKKKANTQNFHEKSFLFWFYFPCMSKIGLNENNKKNWKIKNTELFHKFVFEFDVLKANFALIF
jgi:hypothetical protein